MKFKADNAVVFTHPSAEEIHAALDAIDTEHLHWIAWHAILQALYLPEHHRFRELILVNLKNEELAKFKEWAKG